MPDGGIITSQQSSGGVIINEQAGDPPRPAGVIVNDPAPGGVGNVVYGAVVYFEETTQRDQNRTLDGEQRMTRTFLAYTSEPLVGSTTVSAFDQVKTPFPPGVQGFEYNGNPTRKVPQPGDKYVELDADWNVVHTNPFVVCVDTEVQADGDDPQKWAITCQYAGVSDPLAQPHDVEWDTVPYQEAKLQEVEAMPGQPGPRPVLNSAGDPFESGVMADADRHTCVIVKNVLRYDPVAADGYQNSVNLTQVFAAQHPPGFDPGTAKIKLKAKRIRRSGNTDFYWRVTAVVEIDKRGWDARVRDAGFNYIDRVKGKQPVAMHPRFVGKAPPATAQLLVAPGGDLADPAGAVPAPLTFRTCKRKSWADLTPILNY